MSTHILTRPAHRHRPRTQIAADLIHHLNTSGSTLNDPETERLYLEWHRLPEGAQTELEAVELWAVRIGS